MHPRPILRGSGVFYVLHGPCPAHDMREENLTILILIQHKLPLLADPSIRPPHIAPCQIQSQARRSKSPARGPPRDQNLSKSPLQPRILILLGTREGSPARGLKPPAGYAPGGGVAVGPHPEKMRAQGGVFWK